MLASFVLFSTLPLAGIRQSDSVPDPSRHPGRAPGPVARVSDDMAALAGPLRGMSLALRSVEHGAAGFDSAERVSSPEEAKPLRSRSDPDDSGEAPRREGARAGNSLPHRELHSRTAAPTRAQIFYRKAQGHHRRKELEPAAEMYRQVLREEPGHCDALFHLSSIHMEESRYAEAYPLLAERARLRPDDPQGLTNLAVAEIALGRPEEAIANLEKAAALEDPPRFKIFFHQGVARSRLDRLEEAISWYGKAEGLDPGHAHLLFNMALTHDRLQRYEEALGYYARFLQAAESSSVRERRDVEARMNILMAYLVEEPETPLREGTYRATEQER